MLGKPNIWAHQDSTEYHLYSLYLKICNIVLFSFLNKSYLFNMLVAIPEITNLMIVFNHVYLLGGIMTSFWTHFNYLIHNNLSHFLLQNPGNCQRPYNYFEKYFHIKSKEILLILITTV